MLSSLSLPATRWAVAAQCVMPRLGSHLAPVATAAADAGRVADLLARCPVGGLIVFRAQAETLPAALARLQAASPRPLLMLADLERGAGQQVAGATRFPHAMALGATPDPAAAAATLARITAREARALGVHGAFAPVADVHLEPENPIIATRTFGAEPARVAACVRAYVVACAEAGFLAAAKHAPGHGRTRADSHATLPVVHADRATLAASDFVPQRAAVEAGVPLVMTAHVAFPALDATGAPATASAPILRGLVRRAWGFGGVVVSDSLRMAGIADADPAALMRAGVDLLLDPPDAVATTQALVDAVEAGRLPEERLTEACARVLALKRRVADAGGFDAPPAEAVAAVGSAAHRQAAARLAADALAVRPGAAPGLVPVPREADLLVVYLPTGRAVAAGAEALTAAVRARFPRGRVRTLAPGAEAAAAEALRTEAAAAAVVACAVVVEPGAWQAYGLSDAQRAFLARLTAHRPTLVAALGSPHVLDAAPRAAVAVTTYSGEAVSQAAFADWLAGEEG